VLKKLGIAGIVVGVLVGAFALVWWLVIAPQLLKLPSDIDNTMEFAGTMTLYVDEVSGARLRDGNEKTYPIAATRSFVALPDMFTSSTAFFEDKMLLTVGDKTADPQIAHYAMSRTSRKCVDSEENWAYSEDNRVDRAGVYGPLFPPGLEAGDTLSVYYDDPAKAFDVKVVDKIDDWNQLGITVVKIDASRPSAPYDPEAAEVLLMRGRGLPTQVSLDQVKSALKLNFNISSPISLPFGQSLPSTSAIPDAVKAAVAQIQQVVDAHPLTITYSQESSDFYYIEQTTGATVGVTFDRTTSIKIDTSVAQAVSDLLGDFASLPVVGPKIASALERVNELAASYRDPYPAFNQKITMTDASQSEMAQTAKEKISLMNWARFRIPVIAGAVAALLVLLGVLGVVVGRKKKAA
jgi:hypothetical protein